MRNQVANDKPKPHVSHLRVVDSIENERPRDCTRPPNPPQPPSQEALLAAYNCCGAMLTHYGRSRSGLRTAFLAINFAVLGALFGRQVVFPSAVAAKVLGFAAFLSILFFVIDIHMTHSHRSFTRQATEIEKLLCISLFCHRCEEKRTLTSRIFSETHATYLIYGLTLCFWFSLLTDVMRF